MRSIDAGLLRVLLVLGALGAAACAPGPGPEHDPRPQRLVPAWGLVSEPVPVTLHGENFLELATQHLGGPEQVSVDGRFEAFLDGTPLEDITREDSRTLRARVPPLERTGWYSLEVVGPLGRRVTLPQAYYVSSVPLARLQAGAVLERTQLAVAQRTRLLLTVDNLGGTAVPALAPVLHLSGEGRVEVISAPGSADLGPGGSALFVWELEAAAPGEVLFSLEVRGREASAGVRVEAPPVEVGPLEVRRPAVLTATLVATPRVVNQGRPVTLTLTVTNTGGTAAQGVMPGVPVMVKGGAERVSAVEPASADIPPGESRDFLWNYTAQALGPLGFLVGAVGSDAHSGLEVRAPEVLSADLTVQRPGQLSAVLTHPPSVNVGQPFELRLEVSNPGSSPVLQVEPLAQVCPDNKVLLVSGPEPASADIPGGGRAEFLWRYTGASEGACPINLGAAGTDQTDGSPVSLAAVASSVSVQRPAALAATFAAPWFVGLGSTFGVHVTVTNTGGATAESVLPPGPLASSVSGAVELVSGPSSPVSLTGGGSTTFTWHYRALQKGQVSFSGSVSGTDANSGAALTTGQVSSGPVYIVEVDNLVDDPFGDGSPFSHVLVHGGRLVLGPNRSGTGGVSLNPDGTGGLAFQFSFPKDTSGNSSQNSSSPPYSSIGATGCATNTAACGPDNEDGRGFFFSGRVGTQAWLGIAGARSGGDLDYVYLSPASATGTLDMRFLDLTDFLGGQTKGVSSALFFKDRLYLGFPDTGGSRPYLVSLSTLPTLAPGYEASRGVHGEDLQAQNMPGIGQGGTPQNRAAMQMIDTMAAYNDRLYLANNGGCVRSATPAPGAYYSGSPDWASCTPQLTEWSGLTSRTTSKTYDLEPADRAVPQLAVFHGRLFLARNTTVGPQLFMCEPAMTAPTADCDPGDWKLVARNGSGNTSLSQFDNPANTSVSLLVATARHLYVGFDNATQGVVLLRASTATPINRADFQGAGGCSAAQHPAGCEGLGGTGLGVGATRIFDGVALEANGSGFVYVTAGDGSGPVKLFRLAD